MGGAVVLLDRRRRRREPLAPPRGSDPLTAFTDAPCYREAPPPARRQERLTPGRGGLPAAHPQRDARDPRLARDEQLELDGAVGLDPRALAHACAVGAPQRRLAWPRGKSWACVACSAPAPAVAFQRQPQVGTPISTRERGAARSTVRSVCFQNASEATGPGSLRGPCSFQASTSSLAGPRERAQVVGAGAERAHACAPAAP